MMWKFRFSIAGLMGFVLVAALGFAGLKAADEAWASGCYTLLVVALIVALITANQSRGRNRAYCAGFAIAGSLYFGVIFGVMGSYRVTPPQLLTELLFDRLEAMIHPAFTFTMTGTITSTMTSNLSPLPAAAVPLTPPATAPTVTIAAPTNPAPPTPVQAPIIAFASPPSPPFLMMPPTINSRVHFSQVAHSVTALLAGMLGGIYSAWLFARRERQEVNTAVSPSSP